ncbi:uncharacterized protein EI90DRAFT_3062476, partial [Cantharellus anzutake]|uniref:uncharacterized protein n=1 Tax=Cantharellus anzutake TaxID=1750568 RepID=UPI001905301E
MSITGSPSRFRALNNSVSSSNIGTSTASPSATTVPPEIESTLTRIISTRNVLGVMVLSKEGAMIRHAGSAFEGETGRNYAIAVKRIVDACRVGLEEPHRTADAIDEEAAAEVDEVRFIRIRTRKHELMISPG